MKKGPADGLLEMWGHSFDETGKITRQFQILYRTGDAYVCQLYSLKSGKRSDLRVISRKDIINHMRIYENVYAANEALIEYRSLETETRAPPRTPHEYHPGH